MKLKRSIKKIFRKTRSMSLVKEINYDKLKSLIKSNANMVLIDVRSPQEFNETRLISAINIPFYEIDKKILNIVSDKNLAIILYCQSGARSKKACIILERLGYTNVYNLSGGLDNI